MKLKTESRVLTPGQTWEFNALEHVGCFASTGAAEICADGSASFSTLIVRQRYYAQKPIGVLIIRNPPAAGGNITVTMQTSSVAWDWSMGSPQSVSIDQIGAVTMPIVYNGAEGTPNPAGEVARASGTMPVESYLAGFQASDSKWYPVKLDNTRGLWAFNDDIGAKADASAGTDTGTFSLISLFKRLLAKITTQLPAALGQGTKAQSLPVVVASDQGNLATNVAQINGVAPSMGSGTNGTGVQRVTLATDQAACSVAGLFSVKFDQTTHGTTDKVAADLYTAGGANPGNNGTATANTQRVVIASDNTANSNPWLVKGNISDNTAVAATANLTVLCGRYDATPRALTAGNAAFQSLDATGAEIIGNSNKPSFSYTLNDIAATTGTWNAFTIEQPASATKFIVIKRIVIWNPGKFTTPQTTLVQILRQTTAGATGDGAMTPLVHDTADTATAVGRYGNATSVTAGTTGAVATSFAFWSPAAVAVASPIVIDLTNGGTTKGVVIPKTNNNGIICRILGAAGGSNISITAHWTEE